MKGVRTRETEGFKTNGNQEEALEALAVNRCSAMGR